MFRIPGSGCSRKPIPILVVFGQRIDLSINGLANGVTVMVRPSFGVHTDENQTELETNAGQSAKEHDPKRIGQSEVIQQPVSNFPSTKKAIAAGLIGPGKIEGD